MPKNISELGAIRCANSPVMRLKRDNMYQKITLDPLSGTTPSTVVLYFARLPADINYKTTIVSRVS